MHVQIYIIYIYWWCSDTCWSKEWTLLHTHIHDNDDDDDDELQQQQQ